MVQIEDQQAADTVEKLLAVTGRAFTRVRTGFWTIRANGTNLKYFQIVLSVRSGTLITQVTIAKGKWNLNEVAPALLRLANGLDYVKVGLDTMDNCVVRNEARVKSLDAEELGTNIKRVTEAADRVYLGLLSPESIK